jgi:uncharacterized protein YjbI with pentapeptide repeats
MANPEHLKVLRQGVAAWHAWRLRNPEIIPDLSGAKLNGVTLHGADLHGANLNRTQLTGAKLDGAKLRGANLSSANFSDSHLSGADLRRADLSRADLKRADLRRANFRRADLSGASLTEANLSGANLTEATLSRADLVAANLSGADLTGAQLDWANLSGARLSRANLVRANLSRANLSEASLSRANLSEVSFTANVWANTDLSEVKGLESVRHRGPSCIGIDTFFRSKGKIPEAFLRGAGVPDVFIQYAASLAGAPLEFYSCFISYSHANNPFACRLHDALQGRGIRCWLDEHHVLPGDSVHAQIDRGIRLWDKILLCCSEASLNNSWCVENEIQIALNKEKQLNKERGQKVLALIPLNLDGYLLSGKWQSGMSTHILTRLAADFTGWEGDNSKFEEQLEKLIKALRVDANARERPPKPRL